jgi:predicted nucleic acid-binding Zn ribbon protein
MPTYDYRCEDNGKVFEVNHPMSLSINNWGELCKAGNIDQGDVAAEAPVTKLLKAVGVVKSSALSNPEAPPCMTAGGCGGGNCGM